MYLLLTLDIFHAFYSVSIVDFEQINVSWDNLDLSSGYDDVVFFNFLWHIINTVYFNVVTRYETILYGTIKVVYETIYY